MHNRGAPCELEMADWTVLEAIGIEQRKKDPQFQLANGSIITRSAGYAVVAFGPIISASAIRTVGVGSLECAEGSREYPSDGS